MDAEEKYMDEVLYEEHQNDMKIEKLMRELYVCLRAKYGRLKYS